MMNTKKHPDKSEIFLLISLVLFAVSCLTLSFIPALDALNEDVRRITGDIVATMFWLGLIAGIVFDYLANCEIYRHNNKMGKDIINKRKLPGVITFSSEKKHIILYGVIVLGIVLMISDIILGWLSEYIMFPVISLTLFLFVVHCIIDGKNYEIYVMMKEGVDNE